MTRVLLIALLTAAALGQSTPASSPPEVFEFLQGHGYAGGEHLKWDRGELVSSARYLPNRTVVRQFEPSPQAWKRFWKAVDAAGVWKWRAVYSSRVNIADGEGWSLELRHAGHQVKSKGYNSRPPGFPAFYKAVDQLLKDSKSTHPRP